MAKGETIKTAVTKQLISSSLTESSPSVPITLNKLTSPRALSAIDYENLPLCEAEKISGQQSRWKDALEALYGDAFYRGPTIPMREDQFCQQWCVLQSQTYRDAIQRGFEYTLMVDGAPVSIKGETDSMISTRYFGGVPVGREGGGDQDSRYATSTSSDVFLNNHWRINVYYTRKGSKSQVLHAEIQPFSIQQGLVERSLAAACNTSYPLTFDDITNIPPQSADEDNVLFTYDVVWIQSEASADDRWDVFLVMDNAIQPAVQVVAFFIAVFINAILLGVIWVWTSRDWSYKPVMLHTEEEMTEEQEMEVKLWPLSTRAFFAPRQAVALCILCGTGAQLLVTGLVFLLWFQLGVINMSLGPVMITPAVVIYTFASVGGGYVTGRLAAVCHSSMQTAMKASWGTALIFPLLTLVVVWMTYDVIPADDAPSVDAVSNGLPLIMIWLLVMFPFSIAGGFIGHKGGSISHFPVSQGSGGYHALDLPAEDLEHVHCFRRFCRKFRMPILFCLGGFFPVLCCFISYSYGVAGPVMMGFYASGNLNVLVSYVLFVTSIGLSCALLFYRQMRAQLYNWWWPAVLAAGSSGLWIFVLSLSWLLSSAKAGSVDGSSFWIFTLWFGLISVGVFCLAAFVGVASCIVFGRLLYTNAMQAYRD